MHLIVIGSRSDSNLEPSDIDPMLHEREGVWEYLDGARSRWVACAVVRLEFHKYHVLVARTTNDTYRWGIYGRLA